VWLAFHNEPGHTRPVDGKQEGSADPLATAATYRFLSAIDIQSAPGQS
jgi:hypothetical protein